MDFGLNDFTISFWMKAGTSNLGATGVFSSPMGTGGWHDTSYFQDYGGGSGGRLYPSGATGSVGIEEAAWSVDNIWRHVAIVRKNTVTRIFRDGVITATNTSFSTNSFNWAYHSNFYIGGGAPTSTSYPFAGAIDDFVVVDEAVWDEGFDPPTSYLDAFLFGRKMIYVVQSSQNAYVVSGGVFAKVADDWADEDDAGKIALFDVADVNAEAALTDLATLGGPFKVLTMVATASQRSPVVLTALPPAKTILPEGLISAAAFEAVNSVTFTGAFAGDSGGFVKFAFTTDNETYKVWDGYAWVDMDLGDFADEGMEAAQVHNLDVTELGALLDGAEGFGTAIYISQEAADEVLHVDEMTINADMKGNWAAAVHGADFAYGFYGADKMTVTLASAGTYKINYDKGGD
jgi:hypothetical protein